MKLDPKNPLTIEGAGRGGIARLCSFVAIPKDAVKTYGSEKELHAAVRDGKVAGMAKCKEGFFPFTEVKESDPRKLIVVKYTLEKVDAKDGVVLKQVREDGKPGGEEEETAPIAAAERGMPAFYWLALGLAASGVLGFAGLWLARCRNVAGRESNS